MAQSSKIHDVNFTLLTTEPPDLIATATGTVLIEAATATTSTSIKRHARNYCRARIILLGNRCYQTFASQKILPIASGVDKEMLRAISTPQCVRSISRVECASGLMLTMHPSSSARSCQRQSRSRRQGLALISTATPYSAQASRILSTSRSRAGAIAGGRSYGRGCSCRDSRPRYRNSKRLAHKARRC
jgi:hypothetical protein